MSTEPSHVETIKQSSRFLRGSLGLACVVAAADTTEHTNKTIATCAKSVASRNWSLTTAS